MIIETRFSPGGKAWAIDDRMVSARKTVTCAACGFTHETDVYRSEYHTCEVEIERLAKVVKACADTHEFSTQYMVKYDISRRVPAIRWDPCFQHLAECQAGYEPYFSVFASKKEAVQALLSMLGTIKKNEGWIAEEELKWAAENGLLG